MMEMEEDGLWLWTMMVGGPWELLKVERRRVWDFDWDATVKEGRGVKGGGGGGRGVCGGVWEVDGRVGGRASVVGRFRVCRKSYLSAGWWPPGSDKVSLSSQSTKWIQGFP